MRILFTMLIAGASVGGAIGAASGQGAPVQRVVKRAPAPGAATVEPCQRPVAQGRYACGHTSMRGMYMAYPDLNIQSASTYTQDNKPGTYRYSPATRQITWLSGPLAKTGWHAQFFPVGCEYTDAYGAKNSMSEATIDVLNDKNESVYTGKLAAK